MEKPSKLAIPRKPAGPRAIAAAALATRNMKGEVARLSHRNAVLSDALALSKRTGESIAVAAHQEEKRRNASDEEREAVVSNLRSTQASLLQKIDSDRPELAASTAQLREMSTALILAHEEEQRRIAIELHDQIGQDLTALRMLLGRARKSSAAESRALVAEAEDLAGSVTETVRGICRSMRPQALDDLGLVKGLEWHLKIIGSRTGLVIEFDAAEIDESRLSPIIASAIFRVTQEAITNVLKHARATRARVTISMTAAALEFSVRDDGRGFNPDRVLRHASTGLSSMMERVSLVNGDCRIDSKPKKGACVSVKIPFAVSNAP